MRIKEILAENFGPERQPTDLKMGDYVSHWDAEFVDPSKFKDVAELHTEVDDLLNAGLKPMVIHIVPELLLATQDWLDNSGGGEAFYPEYEKYPVVYDRNGKYYIIDGHHRVSDAIKQKKRDIPIYLIRPRRR